MTGPIIDQNLVVTHDDLVDQVVQETPNVEVNDGDAPLKRSQRTHKPTISGDYVVYL